MNFFKKPRAFIGGNFVKSVNAALEGVVHTLKTEKNMRLHFFFGFLVLILGIYLDLTSIEFMILCFAVTFVLVSEMVNTAIEYTIDLVNDEYHPLAKIVKDIAAGAVFVSAVNAVIVGYILFFKRSDTFGGEAIIHRIKQSSPDATLITLLIVVGLVLFIKILRREKFLLRGGMPSGHSAVAFSTWTIIALITENPLVIILVFFLAFIVARSRMTGGAHNAAQVVAGSILGILVTLLVFQLLT